MSANVQQQGNYRLLKTTHNHRILVLDDNWFAWVDGQESPLLVRSDSDHEIDETLSEGQFYLIDFEGDDTFRDQPHLFLEEDGKFRTLIVPNGLPTEDDTQKRLVESDERVSGNKLERYLS